MKRYSVSADTLFLYNADESKTIKYECMLIEIDIICPEFA